MQNYVEKDLKDLFLLYLKLLVLLLTTGQKKNGFKCSYYDVDMLYPTDKEVEKYFRENSYDIVGLSAATSTTYLTS